LTITKKKIKIKVKNYGMVVGINLSIINGIKKVVEAQWQTFLVIQKIR
jgi:hypothetical protein